MSQDFQRIYEILKREFGPQNIRRLSPIEELVLTILSQNTSDRNRDLAWERLRKRFPELKDILEADLRELEQLIKPAGLNRQKARRIKDALSLIKDRFGDLKISIRGRELYDFLRSIKGVGPKTAAVVALFSYGEPYFPVDIHIFRVAKRIPLAEGKTREEVQDRLTRIVPDQLKMELHLLLIELGRKYCRPKPKCALCPIKEMCSFRLRTEKGPPEKFPTLKSFRRK